jgi:hypothetical protein
VARSQVIWACRRVCDLQSGGDGGSGASPSQVAQDRKCDQGRHHKDGDRATRWQRPTPSPAAGDRQAGESDLGGDPLHERARLSAWGRRRADEHVTPVGGEAGLGKGCDRRPPMGDHGGSVPRPFQHDPRNRGVAERSQELAHLAGRNNLRGARDNDEVMARPARAFGCRLGHSGAIGEIKCAELRPARLELDDPRPRRVARPVIDDDDFNVSFLSREAKTGRDSFADAVGILVGDDNQRNRLGEGARHGSR